MRLAYPANTLLLVGGVPGAGKSHLLRDVKFIGRTRIISADDIRGEVQVERGYDFHAFIPSCIPEARNRFFFRLEKAAQRGENIICEAAYLRSKVRHEMFEVAQEIGYDLDMLLVHCSWHDALDAVKSRERTISAFDLMGYFMQYRALKEEIDVGLPPELQSLTEIDRTTNITEIIFNGKH